MSRSRERRYARYKLVEQVALGNVSAVQALGLPGASKELDSLWQYVPLGATEMYDLLIQAGCTPNPPPNNGLFPTEDYPGEDVTTGGIVYWHIILYDAYFRDGGWSPSALEELRNLPVQALQILYDMDELDEEQELEIEEIGGLNYRGHPFTSARWSTVVPDDYWDSEDDTTSDTDDDVYIPREQNERRPMPAVYRDRVDIPPPTYEEVLEWDATH